MLLQISWLAGALRVIIAALATSRASTQTTFVKFVAAFSSLLLVWFAGDMKSERPSKDDEQHCRCLVWEEKTVLQSLDVAFSAPSRESSFLRGLHSCEGGRRLALLQGDSRVGRARIRKILALAERELSSLDGTCALLNAQQIKMVSREACVCATCSRTGQGLHVCMRAYLRKLLCCWEVLRAVDQTTAMALHLFNFFVRCL